MERHTFRLPIIVVVAVAAIVLGACGSDGPAANLRPGTTIAGGVAPTPTDAPAAPEAPEAPAAPDAPAATQAPAAPEAPVVTEAPAAPDANPIVPEADDGVDLLVVFVIIGAIALAAIAIGALISRSKKSPPDAGTATPSAQSSLLSTSQWITDQLSLELMAAPPATALQRWAVERSRLDNVAIGAQQQYLEAGDPNWQPLAQSMSELAAAIDTNLALRAQDPPNAQLISESTDVVNRHRTTIQQLIAALRPTIRP
jgi:type IV secretory pathway VirB10-like protein